MRSYKEQFKDMIWFELSDISFTQHYKNKNMMNTVILSVQLFALIIGVVFSIIFKVNPFSFLALLNIVMLIFIYANDYICDKTWSEAKTRRDELLAIEDAIDDDELVEEDIHLLVSAIKGYKIKHSNLVLSKLVYRWLSVLNKKRKRTGYKDSNGFEYCVGDIVYNPFAGDYWYVGEVSDSVRDALNFNSNYVLQLYGDDSEHVRNIDEPSNFEIVCTTEDRRHYIGHIVNFMKIYKDTETELEKLEDVIGNEVEDE